MDDLARLLESLFGPLLAWLDRTGLFQTARFSPLYRFAAAIAAVILAAYVMSLLTAGLERRIEALQRVRVLGRFVSISLALYITSGILGDTRFILERGGSSAAVVRSNLGFLLTLGLVVFLEVRLLRKGKG